jgi:hypothetical protein
VAFAAWRSLPLRNDADTIQVGFSAVPDRSERLRALLSGYGQFSAAEIVERVLMIQDKSFQDMETLGPQGVEPWKSYRATGLPERNRRDHVWLLGHRTSLLE